MKKNDPLNGKPWLSWEGVLINGKELPRIRFKAKQKGPDTCEGCRANKGSFHLFGCWLENSPCGQHQFLLDCTCNIRPDEEV